MGRTVRKLGRHRAVGLLLLGRLGHRRGGGLVVVPTPRSVGLLVLHRDISGIGLIGLRCITDSRGLRLDLRACRGGDRLLERRGLDRGGWRGGRHLAEVLEAPSLELLA
jgi:hypothetical protein